MTKYLEYKAMHNRAIKLATMQAKIWKRGYMVDFEYTGIDDDYITVVGTDYCGADIMEEIPFEYMDISDAKVEAIMVLKYDEYCASKERADATKVEDETTQRHGIYMQLKSVFEDKGGC